MYIIYRVKYMEKIYKIYVKFILLFILIFILIFIILFFLNHILNKKEHMTMQNSYLQRILKKNGYEIDIDNFIIKKCINNKCTTKAYKTDHFNTIDSHYLAKNKPASNTIFMNNNIPVPKHIIINNENKSDFLNNYDLKFPAVLKPIDGMQGTDVHTFIKTRKQFIKILENLLIKYGSIMMEEQVYGDNYRIFVFNNQIMDVIKREQPFIIGNGIDTVEKLIINKNNDQVKKSLFPTKKIDYEYILEQGYNKNDTVKKNKKIFITNTINFHNGANPVRINLDEISNENKEMFIKAHKLIKLECSGIDYMSSDIKVPYYKNEGHIIEINDMVDTKIHIDADNGAKPNFLFENIVKSF